MNFKLILTIVFHMFVGSCSTFYYAVLVLLFAAVLSVVNLTIIYAGFSLCIFFIPSLLIGQIAVNSCLQSIRSLILAVSSLLDWVTGIIVVILRDIIGPFAALPVELVDTICWFLLYTNIYLKLKTKKWKKLR